MTDIDQPEDGYARMLRERRNEVVEASWARCDRLFPRRYADAFADHPEVVEWVDAYIDKPEQVPGLLLIGPTGTGKTWQAYGALRRAVTYPRPARGVGYRADAWSATTHSDLLAMMRPGSKTDPEHELKQMRETPLLLVDDLGVGKNSEWVEDVTYRLINGRYEDMRPSIFTSNLAMSDLKAALGERITSRLAETCTRVVLVGADRRRAPKES